MNGEWVPPPTTHLRDRVRGRGATPALDTQWAALRDHAADLGWDRLSLHRWIRSWIGRHPETLSCDEAFAIRRHLLFLLGMA